MSDRDENIKKLIAENEELQARLQEAQDTLEAIRSGEVDALVVSTGGGEQVYTLKSAEQPYRILIERMQEGAVTLLRDGTILYCNQRFAEMAGRPLEEVIGSSIYDRFSPDDHAALWALLDERAGRREVSVWKPGGAELPVVISAGTTTIEGIENLCLVVTDLTEQKRYEAQILKWNDELEKRVSERTEQLGLANRGLKKEISERQRAEKALQIQNEELQTALEENQSIEEELRLQNEELLRAREEASADRQRFADLFNSAPDAYLITDPQGTVQQVNGAALGLLGVTVGEVTGTPLAVYVAEEARGEFLNSLLELRQPGARLELELMMQPRDRRAFKAAVTVAASWEGSDRGSCRWLIRDVSARDRMEQELKKAKEAAESANASKDHFLAVLSHELRTPLTPVLMTASALESDPDVPEPLREDMSMIKRSIELEVSLINDLLDVNRIARGKIELKLRQVDAHAIVQAAYDVCRSEAHVRGLVLNAELKAEHHNVRADSSRLQQIFWNLLKNAMKFTPRGGRIEVRSFNPRPDLLRVEVSDTGIGIEPEAIPRLFNAFEQVSRQVTRQFGGLGLGLAICKSLIELHGGSIRAESGGHGRGSRFIVELPGARAAMDTPSRPGADQPIARRNLRVLVVEDHDPSAEVLSKLLERAGHTVTTAANVSTALDTARSGAFDVLISDLGLPDGSGIDLMHKLRVTHPGLCAIALSGYGMEADIKRSREAGFIEHLTKPVDFKTLSELLERLTRE